MLNFQKSILLFSTSKMAERTQFSYAKTVTCEMSADQNVGACFYAPPET